MSSSEVVRKTGRPKKSISQTITVFAEPVEVKAKKPRVSQKSTTTSPDEQKDCTSSAQLPKNGEPLPLLRKATKQPGSRSAKLVATETAILASLQVKASSTRPEPSLILKEATAFVEGQKAQSLSTPSDLLKVNPQIRSKELKSAVTLPSFNELQAPKPATSTTNSPSVPKTSLFLADFFTEPLSAEQPAWSRPKKVATVSTSPNTSPGPTLAAEAAPPVLLAEASASPLAVGGNSMAQSSAEGQIPVEPGYTATSRSAALSTRVPTQTTQRLQQPAHPAIPSNAPVTPTSQVAMSTKESSDTPNSAPKLPSRTVQQPTLRFSSLPKMPPRTASVNGPKPLKPTETPYEVLRHDPKFKALSRRWTSLIVAIPILVATSYALYGRATGKTAAQTTRGRDKFTSTINGGI